MTVAEALREAEAELRPRSESARLDAELLLSHVLGWPRSMVVGAGRDPIEASRRLQLRQLIVRRANGEPVAYLTGVKEFWSLPLKVTRDVLIPRPETETVVEWALDVLVDTPTPRIADLGTGSGAIALALASDRDDAQVWATDASVAALQVARTNAQQLGILNARFLQGSWLGALGNERFHLIASNPPYVAAGDPHLQALTHEPQAALIAGSDGLDAIREIVRDAPAHLLPRGWLLLEHGAEQGEAVRALLLDAGFTDVETCRDLSGLERVTGGRSNG